MVKNLLANAGNPGLISGLGRFPGEGKGNLVFLSGKFHGQRSLVRLHSMGLQKESHMT